MSKNPSPKTDAMKKQREEQEARRREQNKALPATDAPTELPEELLDRKPAKVGKRGPVVK